MRLIQHHGLKDPICDRADFNAEIFAGKSIVIFGQSGRRATDAEGQFSRRFEVGDRAVYHSYNLKYVGVITSIGEKTIGIDTRMEGTRRLSLVDFIRRNWDYNEAKVDAENAEELRCL